MKTTILIILFLMTQANAQGPEKTPTPKKATGLIVNKAKFVWKGPPDILILGASCNVSRICVGIAELVDEGKTRSTQVVSCPANGDDCLGAEECFRKDNKGFYTIPPQRFGPSTRPTNVE